MLHKLRLRLLWISRDVFHALGRKVSFKGYEGTVRVLCLHGVCRDNQQFINSRFLHESQLENLLKGMQGQVHFLSLQEYLDKKTDPNRLNALVTFDDGYKNNRTLALPILEKYEVPATIFCTTQEVHQDDLNDMDRDTRQSPDSLDIERGGYDNFFELLNDEELTELNQNELIDLANHGAKHISFVELEAEEVIEDIKACEERLNRIGSPFSNVVAYPYGHHSSELFDVLKKEGYPEQFVIEGNPEYDARFHDRLVINPHISTYNQIISLRNGRH
ncbi:polysaccharide deacetylase family protein [Crocinitomicaceae bacterium]|nr:polysaccharide deacetylase family protein [Crocinitomicaceae bacterium]